jgi:hypothetical protein
MFYKNLFIIFLLTTNAFAEPSGYYLCGSDEDGCSEGREQFCACIPAGIHPDKPYCLDFDAMTCNAIVGPKCANNLIFFDNQGACLATIFQSEPNPACQWVPPAFCHSHPVYLCDSTGNPNTCKQQSRV